MLCYPTHLSNGSALIWILGLSFAVTIDFTIPSVYTFIVIHTYVILSRKDVLCFKNLVYLNLYRIKGRGILQGVEILLR